MRTFRERRALAAALRRGATATAGRHALVRGAIVGATNPATVVFVTAILPACTSRGAGHVPEQILLPGLVVSAIGVVSDSAWGVAAGTFRA